MHPTTCDVLSTYQSDFYKGFPAFTKNKYFSGTAYHLAATAEQDFYDDFFAMLTSRAGLERAMNIVVPKGVSITYREKAGRKIIFIQNFDEEKKSLDLVKHYKDLLSGEILSGRLEINGFSARVIMACEEQL